LAEASVAYVPIGSIEFHGPHLPMGVDMVTAEGLCLEAARRSGGVVVPPVYLANGCLDLPHTLTFDPALVEAWTRAVVGQLHHRGVGVVVLVTGHGPLDLIHLLKRVASDFDQPGARAYGLCWLELNAHRLQAPEDDEPTVIDHASTIETSWMLALEPGLVDLAELPADPEAGIVGVYGRNPRFTASAELGWEQITSCAGLLADRVRHLAAGTWSDTGQDLDNFVEYAWPEPMTLRAYAGAGSSLVVGLANAGRASRYISRAQAVLMDGSALSLDSAWCVNTAPGETGVRVPLTDLTPERGIYVRRQQELLLVVPHVPEARDGQHIEVILELGGVRSVHLAGAVTDLPDGHSLVSVLDEVRASA
jgi:creatinine amidohydrolase